MTNFSAHGNISYFQYSRIAASAKINCAGGFITDMTEGYVYLISNFTVAPNNDLSRSTNHRWKLIFQSDTSFFRQDDDYNIPLHGFEFVPISVVVCKKVDTQSLVSMFHTIHSLLIL